MVNASNIPRVLTLRPGRRRAGAAAPRWPRARSWQRRGAGSRSGSPWCSPAPGAAAAAPPPPCARGYTPRAGGEKPRGKLRAKKIHRRTPLTAVPLPSTPQMDREDDARILHYIPDRN